ncbi:hypothetical protein HDV05_006229 [Chytridiales sp. JEL 0842]|nr:hypothetical protein HDV05_006229 [Chytridiales sp. JEL 0842]
MDSSSSKYADEKRNGAAGRLGLDRPTSDNSNDPAPSTGSAGHQFQPLTQHGEDGAFDFTGARETLDGFLASSENRSTREDGDEGDTLDARLSPLPPFLMKVAAAGQSSATELLNAGRDNDAYSKPPPAKKRNSNPDVMTSTFQYADASGSTGLYENFNAPTALTSHETNLLTIKTEEHDLSNPSPADPSSNDPNAPFNIFFPSFMYPTNHPHASASTTLRPPKASSASPTTPSTSTSNLPPPSPLSLLDPSTPSSTDPTSPIFPPPPNFMSALSATEGLTHYPVGPHQRPLVHESFYGFVEKPIDALVLILAAMESRMSTNVSKGSTGFGSKRRREESPPPKAHSSRPSLEDESGAAEDGSVLVGEEREVGPVRRLVGRLHATERAQIRSGSVFLFDMEETGIRRWTDGFIWSPSRIHQSVFLIYRQLAKKDSDVRDSEQPDPFLTVATPLEPSFNAQPKDPNMTIKRDGLIKKTLSFAFEDPSNGGKLKHFHVVSYFLKDDVLNGRLPIPSRQAFARLPIKVGLPICL